jgi:TRAP-type C4-dicarboxylate transport system permease small subunit
MSENIKAGPSWLLRYSKTIDKIEIVLATFSGIVTILLMILIDSNVIGRYAVKMPVPGSVEISVILLVILLITGQPRVQGENIHLRLDFIVEHLSAKVASIIQILVLVISWFLCLLWAWHSAAFAIRSWGDAFFGIIEIPIWPALLIVPISILVMCLRIPLQIYGEIEKLRQLHGKRG